MGEKPIKPCYGSVISSSTHPPGPFAHAVIPDHPGGGELVILSRPARAGISPHVNHPGESESHVASASQFRSTQAWHRLVCCGMTRPARNIFKGTFVRFQWL